MPAAHPRPQIACRAAPSVSSAWWFARWLLVLVLAFDHLSAPFHHHHHGDVEAQPGFAAGPALFDGGDAHVDDAEHLLASHATMAIRVDPSRLAQLPVIDNADVAVAITSVVEALAVADEPQSVHRRPDRSRPDFLSHRSLPPAGRAPPLHA